MASVGEPLNPEAVVWGVEAFGMPFHDNWWQTETGGIMIANFAALDVKPGSMGLPLPGIEAAIVRARAMAGREIDEPMVEGRAGAEEGLAVDDARLSRRGGALRKCFAGDWYLTGDLAKRDADGYFWFVGRADDVIKSAGHLIGPFEVESALMEHPAVAEGRRHRQARPDRRRDGQGLRRAEAGHEPDEALAPRTARPCPQAAGRGGGAEGDRLPRQPAQDALRQDHAPAAQGARTRAAGRRSVDAGKRREMTTRSISTARTASISSRDAAHPPLRGEMRRALPGAEDPRLPPSL
jgi:hypothetical protein